jgi:class III poly(R)-hydroxyalkanoic acid synthase PhaE subunit
MAQSNPFSADEWLEAQRKYWDSWMEMTRKASPATGMPGGNWSGALDQWWRAMQVDFGDKSAGDFFQRIIDLGRGYFDLGGQFTGDGNGSDALSGWLDQMTRAFQSMAEPPRWPAGQGQQDFAAFWQLPMDTWQRTLSSLVPTPGDFMEGIRPDGGPAFSDAVRGEVDRFLSVPGVGYTRETQEQYQHLGRLVMEYETATRNFNAALGRMGLLSVDRFRAMIAAREAPVESLRELFDIWVDACEDVFADFAMSEEYPKLYGEMVNALMALKRGGAQVVDETLGSLNMPTRREMNTLHKRLQETRRELRALRSDFEELMHQNSRAAKTTPAKPAANKTKPAAKPAPKPKAAPKPKTGAKAGKTGAKGVKRSS